MFFKKSQNTVDFIMESLRFSTRVQIKKYTFLSENAQKTIDLIKGWLRR